MFTFLREIRKTQSPNLRQIGHPQTTERLAQNGAAQKEVANAQSLLNILKLGIASRKTASTRMNSDSSRSHLVLSILVKPLGGKITFCDLAGSERIKKSGASGATQKEAIEINKSLTALGDVLQAIVASQAGASAANSLNSTRDPAAGFGGAAGGAIGGCSGAAKHGSSTAPAVTAGADGNRQAALANTSSLSTGAQYAVHIPYRNHKLTQLMQDSIGGQAKTLMFVNLNPCASAADESLMSLRFASRARQVRQKR